MALARRPQTFGLQGKENENISLTDIVKVFSNSINEEQTWAVCYQCIQRFIHGITEDEYYGLIATGGSAILIRRDGSVSFDRPSPAKGPPDKRHRQDTEYGSKTSRSIQKSLECLGLALFQALDYGMKDNEERHLSQSLEHLLELITSDEEDRGDKLECHSADDEGIEHDAGDEDETCHTEEKNTARLQQIIKMCQDRLPSSQSSGQYYKAVCRSLAAEVVDLNSFLDDRKVLLLKACGGEDITVDELDRGDWARLWVNLMLELRNGVKLKKVEHRHLSPLEYELTPYEVLIEDIRSCRYSLNKIMVNGDIPRKVKNDAHDVILNFIRSRPRLRSVHDRILSAAPPKTLNEREKLLDAIRQRPKLKQPLPIKPRKHVESSRTTLFDSDDSSDDDFVLPVRVRTLIKPDISINDSMEIDEEDENEESADEQTNVDEIDGMRTKISPCPMSPLHPLSPPRERTDSSPNIAWKEKDADDLISNRIESKLSRRHSITVCESPSKVVSPNGEGRWSWFRFRKEQNTCKDSIPERSETVPENDSPPKSSVTSTSSVFSPQPRVSRVHRNAKARSMYGHIGNAGVSNLSCCSEHAHEVSKSTNNLAQLNVSELMHVSWKTECPRKSNTHSSIPCADCRPVPKRWQNPIECLSLRLDEVVHIREVLTKAELESFSTRPQLYNQIAKLKLCFTCKKTKFTLFGQWGTKCHLCKRTVCTNCLKKMRIPGEHFEKIPVYALSPTPISPENHDLISKLAGTGSTPPSPVSHKPIIRPLAASSGKRRPLSRAHTITTRPAAADHLAGPQTNVCCECKNMLCEIIRVSRTSVTLASHGNDWQPQRSRPSRNLHLDLKPV